MRWRGFWRIEMYIQPDVLTLPFLIYRLKQSVYGFDVCVGAHIVSLAAHIHIFELFFLGNGMVLINWELSVLFLK